MKYLGLLNAVWKTGVKAKAKTQGSFDLKLDFARK